MNDEEYTRRLLQKQMAPWKRILQVQAPYRWNLRRLKPGYTLEIGCGIGRNLEHLRGNGVGLDTSASSVRVAVERGFRAYTPEAFRASEHAKPGSFDSILVSHVLEHMTGAEAIALLKDHLEYLKPEGKVILITPQERGYRSDPTHVEFVDFTALERIVSALALVPRRKFSFPFPRALGEWFIYNEFVMVAEKRSAGR